MCRCCRCRRCCRCYRSCRCCRLSLSLLPLVVVVADIVAMFSVVVVVVMPPFRTAMTTQNPVLQNAIRWRIISFFFSNNRYVDNNCNSSSSKAFDHPSDVKKTHSLWPLGLGTTQSASSKIIRFYRFSLSSFNRTAGVVHLVRIYVSLVFPLSFVI